MSLRPSFRQRSASSCLLKRPYRVELLEDRRLLTVDSWTATAAVSGAVDTNHANVTPAATASNTTLTSSVSPVTIGEQVTFTAIVSTASGNPTGRVTFLDGPAVLGSAELNLSHGKETASLSTSSLTLGAHNVTAVYSGGGKYAGSTSKLLVEQVNKATTTTALSSSSISLFGDQLETFTATVKTNGGVIPTGSVTFKDGNMVVGTSNLVDIFGQFKAVLTTDSLASGADSITAVYSGDTDDIGSTSAALTGTAAKATTFTSLSPNANPASFGQPITLTSIVRTTTGGVPTGSVTFKDGTAIIGAGSLVRVQGQMQATLVTSSLAVGTHSITAVYSSDANSLPSTSAPITEQVRKSSTTTSLASSLNPSMSGQPVTLTAAVLVTRPGVGIPTGIVSFLEGTSVLGSGTLRMVGGVVQTTFTTSTLSVGSHQITAVYAGSPNFNGSTSTILTQTVNVGHAATAAIAPFDANGDGQMSPLDMALAIINQLNSGSSPGDLPCWPPATRITTDN